MRSHSILLSLFSGLVVAAPGAPSCELAARGEFAKTCTIANKRAFQHDILTKRDCPLEGNGVGPPPPGSGSDTDFQDPNNILSQAAQAAVAPDGYTTSFTNIQDSLQQAGYLGYQILNTDQYDVNQCATICNNTNFCVAFNIYYERDPLYTPGPDCPNPAAVTNIKCALYGYPVVTATADDDGQYQGPPDANGNAFHIVIAGSNGYTLTSANQPPGYTSTSAYTNIVSVPNFDGPSNLLDPGAIQADVDPATGQGTYLGYSLYNTSMHNPIQCAQACQTTTAYDAAHADSNGLYKPCNFFNIYILSKNGVPQGTYCSFYTRAWDDSFATNTGYEYQGDVYTISASFSYALSVPDDGNVNT